MALVLEISLWIMLCFLSCCVQGKALPEDVDVEGYYWRDYLGEIPHDAVEGGPDGTGDTMYIGQTVYMGLKGPILVPGQISEQNQTLYFEWGKQERTVTENIKILCAAYPEKLEWLRTSTDEITRLADKHLVLGGFEGNYTVYIGRVLSDGEWTIAKVLVVNDKALLHATKDGKDDYHLKFEILNYNRNIPTLDQIKKSVERKLPKRVSTPNSASKIKYVSNCVIATIFAFLFLI